VAAAAGLYRRNGGDGDTARPCRFFSPNALALTGIALSACWASVTDYLLLSRPQEINNALLWLTGSLWARDGAFVIIVLPLLAILLP
jgi:iron complex transport system permease protein